MGDSSTKKAPVSGPRRWRRVVLLVLRNPVATLVFGVLLAYYSSGRVRLDYDVNPSAPRLSGGGSDAAMVIVVRTPSGLSLASPTDPVAAPRAVGTVWYAYRRRGVGSGVGVVREVQGIVITGTLSTAECDRVQALYIDYLANRPEAFWQRVSRDLGAKSVSGVARNRFYIEFFFRLMLLGLLINSLSWVFRVLRWIDRVLRQSYTPLTPQEKRWRSLSRGQCPECAYDISGLPGMRCPECGEEWQKMELTAWAKRGRDR